MRLPLLLLLVKVVGLTNLVVNKGKSWSLCTPALTVPNQPTPVDDSELLAVHLQQLAQVVQLLLHTRHAGCLQLLALTDTQLLLLLLLFARPVTTSRQGWGSCCCRAGVNRAVQQQYHMADIGACLDWKQAATVHAWSTHTHNPAWRLRCTLAHTNKGAAPTNLHKQNIPAGEGIQMGTCMLAVSVRAHTNTHTPLPGSGALFLQLRYNRCQLLQHCCLGLCAGRYGSQHLLLQPLRLVLLLLLLQQLLPDAWQLQPICGSQHNHAIKGSNSSSAVSATAGLQVGDSQHTLGTACADTRLGSSACMQARHALWRNALPLLTSRTAAETTSSGLSSSSSSTHLQPCAQQQAPLPAASTAAAAQ